MLAFTLAWKLAIYCGGILFFSAGLGALLGLAHRWSVRRGRSC